MARARTASGARASTCWPASTRACAGWASSTSTSSTPTASTPRRRSRRRWARSTPRCARARRCTPGSPRTPRSARAEAAAILRELGTPLLIHQPSYSLLNRWIEDGLLDVLERDGVGCIVFSPLAQGLLTDRYLDGDPRTTRAPPGEGSSSQRCSPRRNLERVRALNEIAAAARPVARAAGAGVDAARPAGDLRAHRRQQRRAARGQRRGAGPARLHADELEEIDRHAQEGDSTSGRRRATPSLRDASTPLSCRTRPGSRRSRTRASRRACSRPSSRVAPARRPRRCRGRGRRPSGYAYRRARSGSRRTSLTSRAARAGRRSDRRRGPRRSGDRGCRDVRLGLCDRRDAQAARTRPGPAL